MAGRVRGLGGNMNDQGAAYLENILINTFVVEACRKFDVKKIVAMGTIAMYPDPLPCNPLREETIWMGVPHHSEYGYAQAKRSMLAQLVAYKENYGLPFVLALSTNLYGPFDRFNTQTGHVIPSLVKKFYDAKKIGGDVVIWGDGTATRDFLYIDDVVRALVLLMDEGSGVINLATGKTHTIKAAATILAEITDMKDHIKWDTSKPNGQVFRSYDVSKLASLGFSYTYDLEEGLRKTFAWYQSNAAIAREK
jgi:GDP-L-fucose synthase